MWAFGRATFVIDSEKPGVTMAYSKTLDGRIGEIISGWENIIPREMFGGVCYLLNGNIVCGVYKDYLILRLGEQEAAAALQKPGVSEFDITGRPMNGWVMVEERACAGKNLEAWLNKARGFVAGLPVKRRY
jgi:TfoX/Sxy family transcriptional regulator of competence genes